MYEFLDEVPRKYHKVDFSREKGYEEPEVKREEAPLKLANVISSLGTDGLHYPVLERARMIELEMVEKVEKTESRPEK